MVDSGLYRASTERDLLITHEECSSRELGEQEGLLLRPEQLGLISYPYEWSFSQLKDAALCVLDAQELALAHGMSLKDASAYNVQFRRGKPVIIDTLSFEVYEEGAPWIAYRQFCQHFLVPLLLVGSVDVRLSSLQRDFIDGVPVDLGAKIAKGRAPKSLALYLHVFLHGKNSRRSGALAAEGKMSKTALLGLLKSLRQAVHAVKLRTTGSPWSSYDSTFSYEAEAAAEKAALVGTYLDAIPESPQQAWDLGANTGEYSRIIADRGIETVAWDGDPVVVDAAYRKVRDRREPHLLPLIQDFASPSPAIGWENRERMSFVERGPADLSMALALIHHLAIGNSVPLDRVADFFAGITRRWLIIEFVDPEDPRAAQLLSARRVAHPYDRQTFEEAFSRRFEIARRDPIRGSSRALYLLRCRDT